MNLSDYYEYCMAKKGVTEHFPFDEDTLVFKIGGKMFTLTSLMEWEKGTPSVNLKCTPEYSEQLRSDFEGIAPGFHMNKNHWNTVNLRKDVPLSLVFELIDHSYDLIFKSLTKKMQSEINN